MTRVHSQYRASSQVDNAGESEFVLGYDAWRVKRF